MAPGVQETETFANLIERAETKATEMADISQFDFVDFLETGGVLMPRDTITVFTDGRASAEILSLYRQHDDLQRVSLAEAEGDRQRKIDARYAELLPTVSPDWKPDGVDSDDDDDDDDSMVGEEEDDRPTVAVGMAALWTRVFEEFPEVVAAETPEATHLMDEADRLQAIVWDSRIIVDLEGVQPGAQRAIEDQIEEEMRKKHQLALTEELRQKYSNTRRADETVALSITRIQIPSRKIDNDFSAKRMPPNIARRFLTTLPQSQVDKLLIACQMLSTVAQIVEPQVDAGFPGRRAVPAGEPVADAGDQDVADVPA